MRSFVKVILCCLFPMAGLAQKDITWGYINKLQADSLRNAIRTETKDTLNMAAVRKLGFYYQESNADSAGYFHEEQLRLAKKLGVKMWEADAYSQAGYVYNLLGNSIKSHDYFLEAQKLAEDKKNESSNWREWTFSNAENLHNSRIAILAMNYQMMGNVWIFLGDSEKRKASYWEAAKLGESINNGKIILTSYGSLANVYPVDSAIQFLQQGLQAAAASGYPAVGWVYMNLAFRFSEKKMNDSAFFYAYKAKAASIATNDMRTLSTFYEGSARYYYEKGNRDSVLYYAKKAFETAWLSGAKPELVSKYETLAYAFYFNAQPDSAVKYWQMTYELSDSLKEVQVKNLTSYQKQAFNEQLRLKKVEELRTAYENRLKMMGLLALVAGILVVALILYRNNRQKQKANRVLQQTLVDLKSTQAQLVQSEKMASLGELTAGIAHEIQNPLNFVNNFSEVNAELIEELVEEVDRGNTAEVKVIAKDIKENEEKINHHGKRADAIVKGMLQHSRSNVGQKEPTDINALTDEYVRLAYHGLRAKDKSFNATLKTEYDESVGNIDVIPQDIGRVLLNLVNNAFYTVDEKKKQGLDNYQPTVTVSTKKINDKIEIKVADNGNGIPQKILDKIYQPFFTTKPTGQGTGLGLSLSYDIVKAHSGELEVTTEDQQGSAFTIFLPANI